MPPVHLVLADHDYEYVNHFARWLTENKPNQFRVSVFTEPVSFINFISDNLDRIDIILAAEDFLVNTEKVQNVIRVILGQADKLQNMPAVRKYQPAPAICSELQSLLSVNMTSNRYWHSAGSSELVVCFSPNIYLKSAFAFLLSSISEQHVYVSLEAFPFYTMDDCITPYSKNLSDILYNIKSQKGNPAMVLESAVVSDGNISFVPPMDNPGDLWELTDEETYVFIEALKSWGHFSRIILDADFNSGPVTMKFLKAASYIIIPFDKKHMHQIPRIKNMLSGVCAEDRKKAIWAWCGSDEFLLPYELENCHAISWVNESVLLSPSSISLGQSEKVQLENLFKNNVVQ